jgi:hypothetical protein
VLALWCLFTSVTLWTGLAECQQGAARPLQEEAAPHPHQLDLELINSSNFVASGSITRVRGNGAEGSGLHLNSDLGIATTQMPAAAFAYWFNTWNAIQLRSNYIFAPGSTYLSHPVTFNGTVFAPGQRLKAAPSPFEQGGLYYKCRLPTLSGFDRLSLLNGLDLRLEAGLEYTYLTFAFPHPKVIGKVNEPQEDFHNQEIPIPSFGLEARRPLGRGFYVESYLKGNWVNRWPSPFHPEPGTIALSQSSFEVHCRVGYSNPRWLGGVKPIVGFNYYFYSQTETSQEDGNLIRLSSFGPEFGLAYSF